MDVGTLVDPGPRIGTAELREEERERQEIEVKGTRRQIKIDEEFEMRFALANGRPMPLPETEKPAVKGAADAWHAMRKVSAVVMKGATTETHEDVERLATEFLGPIQHFCKGKSIVLSGPAIVTSILAQGAGAMSMVGIEEALHLARAVVPVVRDIYMNMLVEGMIATLVPTTLTANQSGPDIKGARRAIGVIGMTPVRVEVSGKLKDKLGGALVDSAVYRGQTLKVYMGQDKALYVTLIGIEYVVRETRSGGPVCSPAEPESDCTDAFTRWAGERIQLSLGD